MTVLRGWSFCKTQKAVSKAKDFHRSEADLIDVLQEVDSQKTFLRYGCTSLHDYCVKLLKMSDDNTYNFVKIARKSKEVPELKEALRNQEITVSKARRIASVMTKDNSEHWLELAKTLPKPQLEKEVAKVAPKAATPEKAKYVSEDRLQINLGVSEKCMRRLRRVQDLVSQKNRKPASLEDSLGELLEFYLQRNDPIEKAKRCAKLPGPGPGENEEMKGSRKLLAQIKHQINLRDQGQCTHVHDGKRCANSRWLEFHHKVPLAKGGSNNLDNLTTLCWSHHRIQH